MLFMTHRSWLWLDDPGRNLELAKHGRTIVIGDARVDRRRSDGLVSEMVLYEFKGNTGIEEMGGDRVPERMAAVAAVKAS